MKALFDASVLVAGTVGSRSGPSATLISLSHLGGIEGITVDNTLVETQRHLVAEFNAQRLKISLSETKMAMEYLRSALVVHPWINPVPTLLPDNRKDAYLFAAIEEYNPDVLLTTDERLWGGYQGAQIMHPKLLLEQLDTLELS